MKILLAALALLMSSCRSSPSLADYFDLYFITPKNPFAHPLTDQAAAD